ncbi:MAG: prepilin-type N-terminal cleavage/methylation domain-containing protein [Gemmataceae bacterium]|nr:prepilin-type N-terminal cleavage/methylation domain-containing protein [Gemmataceae bacterium]
MTRTATRARQGFTIVELMVAAAICVIIMAILASCFQMGIDTMRHLKATGDMADQLRAASVVIRRDLKAEHFARDPNATAGTGTRVSDLQFDTRGAAARPTGGFFRVRSTTPISEQADAYTIGSFRADATTGHQLHFTGILSGKSDQEFYYTQVRGTDGSDYRFNSRMAEVAYFLDVQPRGQTSSGLPLCQLIRRQRLIAEATDRANLLPSSSNTDATRPAIRVDDPGVIALKPAGAQKAPGLLEDLVLVTSGNRLAPGAGGVAVAAGNDANLSPLVNPLRLGDDILLSNVLSFEVKLIWTHQLASNNPRPFSANTDAPFDTLGDVPGLGAVEFDTGAATPLQIRVRAVQIRIRVWDPKLQMARQATIVQDL